MYEPTLMDGLLVLLVVVIVCGAPFALLAFERRIGRRRTTLRLSADQLDRVQRRAGSLTWDPPTIESVNREATR